MGHFDKQQQVLAVMKSLGVSLEEVVAYAALKHSDANNAYSLDMAADRFIDDLRNEAGFVVSSSLELYLEIAK